MPLMRARPTERGSFERRVLDLAVWLVASAVIATMVAIGGSAVQVTSATPDPMVWCRPLSGSTICIRERS